jgi:hypothetical protein
LENLQALKNEADGQPGEENVSQALTSELKEKYNRMPCLNLAVYLNHPSCVRVLLECIAKVGPEFSKKVMKWRNGHGYCACFMAIYNNNLECILVSHCRHFHICHRPKVLSTTTQQAAGHRLSYFGRSLFFNQLQFAGYYSWRV